jgi:hypothetical protein
MSTVPCAPDSDRHKSFAQSAPFWMSALTRCIGWFAAAWAHSGRSRVVTGNCAVPTTLEAVLIKAVITAHSAGIRRPRMAIVFDGAMP